MELKDLSKKELKYLPIILKCLAYFDIDENLLHSLKKEVFDLKNENYELRQKLNVLIKQIEENNKYFDTEIKALGSNKRDQIKKEHSPISEDVNFDNLVEVNEDVGK
jgi:hypothetical protein